jgi:hypothetical protein
MLLPTEHDNHFAVTPDMVSGIALKDIPDGLHITIVREIKNGMICINRPISYCVHRNFNNKAELGFVFQLPIGGGDNAVKVGNIVKAVREYVIKTAHALHIFDVSELQDGMDSIYFMFKQIVNGATFDDVIQSSNLLKDNVEQFLTSLNK